uniref:glutathione peroxidase n=1 Tax=Oreochromis aureus TaxID=47969 RepID=A0AAZ1X3R5_OREAU
MSTSSPASGLCFLIYIYIVCCFKSENTLCSCWSNSCSACLCSLEGTIYKYRAKTLNGSQTVNFSGGKKVSPPELFSLFSSELNALYEEMKPHGLTILGFPCNQFGKQEPGQRHEILPGLKHVRPGNGFIPNFLLFEKGDVNGKNEQEVYTFLKVRNFLCATQSSCPPVGIDFGPMYGRLFWEPLKSTDIKWNFEKFLVGRDGKPVMRWHPTIKVSVVRADVRRYLLEQYAKDVFN